MYRENIIFEKRNKNGVCDDLGLRNPVIKNQGRKKTYKRYPTSYDRGAPTGFQMLLISEALIIPHPKHLDFEKNENATLFMNNITSIRYKTKQKTMDKTKKYHASSDIGLVKESRKSENILAKEGYYLYFVTPL